MTQAGANFAESLVKAEWWRKGIVEPDDKHANICQALDERMGPGWTLAWLMLDRPYDTTGCQFYCFRIDGHPAVASRTMKRG